MSTRAERRKANPTTGKNKGALRLEARRKGYRALIEPLGFNGDALPKRWGPYNRPGSKHSK